MKSDLVLVAAILCLCILGVAISVTQPEASKLLYVIVGIIAAIAGVSGTIVAKRLIVARAKKQGKNKT